jgi:transcription elongation factor Elf1
VFDFVTMRSNYRYAISKMTEHFFACPYCWQQISMLLDVSAGGQNYVEDCEVCCNPIQISYQVEDGNVTDFTADAVQQ